MGARMRMTRAKTGSRRANHALSLPALTSDKETSEPRLRHRASPTTGRYRGRVVIDVAAKLEKQEEKRKRREREAVMRGEQAKADAEEAQAADEKITAAETKETPERPLDPAKLSQK